MHDPSDLPGLSDLTDLPDLADLADLSRTYKHSCAFGMYQDSLDKLSWTKELMPHMIAHPVLRMPYEADVPAAVSYGYACDVVPHQLVPPAQV